MAIAALQNIPGTPEELAQWAFAHQAHHVDLNAAIYNQLNIALPQFVLDPFDPSNEDQMGTWSYLHQQMHENQNFILGLAGANLVDVDWSKPEELAAWVQLNFIEHLQASNILGVG